MCTTSIAVDGAVIAVPLEGGREVSQAKCVATSPKSWSDRTTFRNGCGVGK